MGRAVKSYWCCHGHLYCRVPGNMTSYASGPPRAQEQRCRCGFARTQAAYDAAYDALFQTLDELEARLGRQRYLAGRQITEADWRLFPTLVRFDVAYFSLFKCNRQRIADYPNLSNYMRELYQIPGIAATVTARYYVINYYSIKRVNPTGIIPRERLSTMASRTTAHAWRRENCSRCT